jgi:hypothetical protein
MWSALVLGGALALGQPPAPPTTTPAPDTLRVVAELQPGAEQLPAPVPSVTIPLPGLVPAPSPAPQQPAPAPPDRGAVMRALQGTWYGALLDDNRMGVSGWTQGAFTASTDRINQLPIGFNYRANDFLLQQNWLRFERTVNQSVTTPTWGFRTDTILPGADYRYTLARGLLNSQLTANNGQPNLYGFDPVQFYGELYLPQLARGTDVKVGRFYAQFGVESIETTQNALISHAYNFVYNPFTHTGVLTTTKLSDDWSVQNGLVTGSDMFIGPEANPTYIGSVKWAPPSGRDSVLFSVIIGGGRYNVSRAFSNPEVFDLVYTHKFSERLSYALDALYSAQHNFPGAGARGFVNDWGLVHYITYQFTPTLSGTLRAEVFGDPQGQRTGTRGIYQEVTAGLTYKPKPWLWLRQEVRYDHNDGKPFEAKPDLLTAAFDFVLRW